MLVHTMPSALLLIQLEATCSSLQQGKGEIPCHPKPQCQIKWQITKASFTSKRVVYFTEIIIIIIILI